MKYIHWNHKLAAMLLIACLFATGCRKKNSNPFPESGKIAGWDKTSETRTFDPGNLWQYIDGDSEEYIQAGVKSTATSDYKYQNKLEATVDVYTMSGEAGARKIFEADPQANATNVVIGDAGRLFQQSVVFRKGPYLVRIVAFEPAPGAADALLLLAHGVEDRL